MKRVIAVLLAVFFSAAAFGEDIATLRKRAEGGDVAAQCELGFLFSIGRNVTQNYKESLKWYRKAAEQGNLEAQCSLGVSYYSGRGVPRDFTQAHLWLNIAGSKGHAVACAIRDFIEAKMTPEQIAKAQELALKKAQEIEERMAKKQKRKVGGTMPVFIVFETYFPASRKGGVRHECDDLASAKRFAEQRRKSQDTTLKIENEYEDALSVKEPGDEWADQ